MREILRILIIHRVINTLLGGLTIDPAGMHCLSWDDAFVSNLYCFEIWRTRSTRRRNHMCQIFGRSVQGLQSSDTPKLPFPTDLLRRPYNSVRTAMRHCELREH